MKNVSNIRWTRALKDMLEVMYAIAEARGFSIAELEHVRVEKADKRGGFKDRIFLEKVDE